MQFKIINTLVWHQQVYHEELQCIFKMKEFKIISLSLIIKYSSRIEGNYTKINDKAYVYIFCAFYFSSPDFCITITLNEIYSVSFYVN